VGSYLRRCAAPLRSKIDTVGTATAGTRGTRRRRHLRGRRHAVQRALRLADLPRPPTRSAAAFDRTSSNRRTTSGRHRGPGHSPRRSSQEDPLSGNPSRWARSETIDARGAAHLPTTGQMCMRRRRSSCDGVGGNEAGLVGQHYGVHAVADSELGEEAIDVGLDCCLAEDEVLGDFVVG